MERAEELRTKLRALNAELNDIYAMSEEALQFAYNSDNRAEVIAWGQADIADIQAQLDEAEAENDPDGEMEDRLYHFAFRTEADFWAYKGY